MSLSKFITRPALVEVFKTLSIPERTPPAVRGAPLRVESHGRLQSLVGVAFDYLARMHIARVSNGLPVTVHDRRWVAYDGCERMTMYGAGSPKDERHLEKQLDLIAEQATAYMSGSGDLGALAEGAQVLANAELLLRSPGVYDPHFKPNPEVSAELLKLVEIFSAQDWYHATILCALNPKFTAGHRVGGADADVLIDERLIELKTYSKLAVTQDDLLQLAGYAALQRMEGIDGLVGRPPLRTIGIYFSRHGRLVEWEIASLFPGDGFDLFCSAFEEQIEAREARLRQLP